MTPPRPRLQVAARIDAIAFRRLPTSLSRVGDQDVPRARIWRHRRKSPIGGEAKAARPAALSASATGPIATEKPAAGPSTCGQAVGARNPLWSEQTHHSESFSPEARLTHVMPVGKRMTSSPNLRDAVRPRWCGCASGMPGGGHRVARDVLPGQALARRVQVSLALLDGGQAVPGGATAESVSALRTLATSPVRSQHASGSRTAETPWLLAATATCFRTVPVRASGRSCRRPRSPSDC